MNDIVLLNCNSCGASLKVASDVDRFVCPYCGNEYLVNRNDSTTSISLFKQSVDQFRQGVDRVELELSIQRLQRERMELAQVIRAKQHGYDYKYSSQSGLVGVVRALTSKQKQKDKEELDKLYELAKYKRAEQERLTSLLSY